MSGRFAHTATGLEDGRVLVSGGWLNGIPAVFTASTELWDPAALVLDPARPAPDTPIGSHEASP